MNLTDDDGTPLRRDRDGELVPDHPTGSREERRAELIAACRAALHAARNHGTENT